MFCRHKGANIIIFKIIMKRFFDKINKDESKIHKFFKVNYNE